MIGNKLKAKATNQFNYYLNHHKDKALNSRVLNSTKNLNCAFRRLYPTFLKDDIDLYNCNVKPANDFPSKFFNKSLASIVDYSLQNSSSLENVYINKGKEYSSQKGFNFGAYSESRGLLKTRETIGAHLKKRDQLQDINLNDLYLTNGGINAYDHAVNLIFNHGEKMLVPNLCFPTYSAFNDICNVVNVPYNYDASSSKITYETLEKALARGRQDGGVVKALLIVNPHNPSGKVLTRAEMEEVVEFCVENSLVLIASESVNSIDHELKDFLSFANVITKMEKPYNQLELFSVCSMSSAFNKGAIKAGYLFTLNLTNEVKAQLYKYKSIDLCSSIPGQTMMEIIYSSDTDKNPYRVELQVAYQENRMKVESNNKNMVTKLSSSGIFKFPEVAGEFSVVVELNLPEYFKAKKPIHQTLSEYYCNCLASGSKVFLTPDNDFWLERPAGDYVIIQNHFGDNEEVLKRINFFNNTIKENKFNEDYLNEFFFEKNLSL